MAKEKNWQPEKALGGALASGGARLGKWWLGGMPLGDGKSPPPAAKAIMQKVLDGKLSVAAAKEQLKEFGGLSSTPPAQAPSSPAGGKPTAAGAAAFYGKNTPQVHDGSPQDNAARLGGAGLAAPTLAGAQKTKPAAATSAAGVESVKQVQQILRNHGYNITVDGIEGPQTESALSNYHSSSGNAKAWNTAVEGGKGSPAVKPSASTDYTPPAGRVAQAAGGGKPPASTKTTAPAGQTLEQLIAGATGNQLNPSDYTVNPGKFGAAEAAAQYNPQISAGQLGIKQATAQDKVNMADLGKWFGDAASLTASGAKQSAADYKSAEVDQNAAGKGILAAFGGNAGAGGQSIANTGNIASGALAQEAANTGSFDQMMKGMVGTLGASTKHTQQTADTTNIATMRQALTSLIAAKANALFTDTNTGKQQNLQTILGINNANSSQKAAAVNQAIAEAELPGNLALQGLKQDNYKSEIGSRDQASQNASTALYLKRIMDSASLKHTGAEINALHARTTGSGKSLYSNATLTDILGVRSYLAGAIKAGNYKTPQEVAQAVKTYSPWDTTNPSVFTKVILPSLAQAGVSGVTPGMFATSG